MRYDPVSDKVEERRRLDSATSSGYRREVKITTLETKGEEDGKWGNGDIGGPRSCGTNIYIIWLEGVWHHGMLKVKVVVAMGMAAGRSQACGTQCGQ